MQHFSCIFLVSAENVGMLLPPWRALRVETVRTCLQGGRRCCCRTLWTRSCGPQGKEKAESYNSTLNGSPKRGSPLDCALYCPCTTIIGGCWFFTALDVIPNVSHTRSADRWGATVISESLLAAEMSKLPVCAGDKHDTAPSIFQDCLCHAGNY